MFEERPYQTNAVNSVKHNVVNLLVMPQRSGKSRVFELIIDKFKPNKVLILVGYRKIVEQLATYYTGRSTHILSGKPFDNTKQVQIASFQTLSNRLDEIDITQYDMIIQDEYHSRTSTAAKSIVFQDNTTIVLATGTPLTNKNKLLTEGIDNYIQPTTVVELLNNNWIAPTRFFSHKNTMTDNKALLRTNKLDFDEDTVKQLISKEGLLDSIRKEVIKGKMDTEHNVVIYVNYIETAEKVYELLSDLHNVNIVHSKMSNKEQSLSLERYENDHGILVNVRALSLGWDSHRTDRLIYAFFTQIHHLALQILWRSSTINPKDKNKEAHVIDLTGQLATVNPFTDFSEYGKHKPSCMEEALLLESEEERYYMMLACKGDSPISLCNGEIPSTYKDNPYVIDFTVEGTPCKRALSTSDFKYKTTEDPLRRGIIYKKSMCKNCGCITTVILKTLTLPEELVEVYNEDVKQNSINIIVNKTTKQALVIADDLKLQSYKFRICMSQDEIMSYSKKVFKGKTFTVQSNVKMSKIPHTRINKLLDDYVEIVDWYKEDPEEHQSIIKKVINMRANYYAEKFNYNPHSTFYFMKLVTPKNEKQVVSKLYDTELTKSEFVKYKFSLEADKEEPYKKDTQSMYKAPVVHSTPISFDMTEDECPFNEA